MSLNFAIKTVLFANAASVFAFVRTDTSRPRSVVNMSKAELEDVFTRTPLTVDENMKNFEKSVSQQQNERDQKLAGIEAKAAQIEE